MSITILDGSLGQELVHRHGGKPTPFWSTSVMLENPDMVGQLHSDYFAAGAQIATTNTYALLPDRLIDSEFEDRFAQLATTALSQATSARLSHGSGLVVGSLGPLGASYRTDFKHTHADAEKNYGPLIDLISVGVDAFVAETMSSLRQIDNAVHVLSKLTKQPIWIALSTSDEDGTKLRSGEDLREAASLIKNSQIEAVLINCSRPEVVSDGLKIIRNFDKPIGAYANGFTNISNAFLEDKPTVDALVTRKDLDANAYADFAENWAEAGATLIGGCCEVGPAHIAELKKRFS